MTRILLLPSFGLVWALFGCSVADSSTAPQSRLTRPNAALLEGDVARMDPDPPPLYSITITGPIAVSSPGNAQFGTIRNDIPADDPDQDPGWYYYTWGIATCYDTDEAYCGASTEPYITLTQGASPITVPFFSNIRQYKLTVTQYSIVGYYPYGIAYKWVRGPAWGT